ncbi:MAG: DUF5119 domain-containing protein [Prevotella sp.]|nr:DUF5119 domain-containing protein [Prevotella sp.]
MKHSPQTLRLAVARAGLLIFAICLLTGCEYKDLCYDHHLHAATLKVSFDWQKAPQHTAKGMTVLFYNMDNPSAQPVRYDYSLAGGTATLEPGRWRAVTYNNDTEAILYRNMNDCNTLEAYTRESSIEEGTQLSRAGMPRANGTEIEPVILEPDPLWGCASEVFTLGVDEHEVSLVLYPEARYQTLTIDIINVPNLQYTGSFGGALSGLAASRFIASGKPSELTATQAFSVSRNGENSLRATMNIFGHCPKLSQGVANEHMLTIYAILADGTKWYYSIDVTDEIHQAAQQAGDDLNMAITIEGLPVPKPIVNGSGFKPTIDGWQGVEIEIGM